MRKEPPEWDPMAVARYLDGNASDKERGRVEEHLAHDRNLLQLVVDHRSRHARQEERTLSVKVPLLAACLIAAFGASYAMGVAVADMKHERESVEARFTLI